MAIKNLNFLKNRLLSVILILGLVWGGFIGTELFNFEIASADSGAPPINGTTTQTWYVDGQVLRDHEWINTSDIQINDTAAMDWLNIIAHVNGSITVNNTGFFNFTNCVITLTGNLTIHGIVTLNNVTLILNNSYDGECNIDVGNNGAMYVYDDSLITSSNTNNEFMFVVRDGSSFEMKNSELHECGWEDVLYHRGLEIYTDVVVIENNTFTNNGYNRVLHFETSNNSIVKNNSFYDTTLPSHLNISVIYFKNSDNVTISENHIFNFTSSTAAQGIHLEDSDDFTISENRIHDIMEGGGAGHFIWFESNCDNNIVSDNQLYNFSGGGNSAILPNMGIEIDNSINNTFINNSISYISGAYATGIAIKGSSSAEFYNCHISDIQPSTTGYGVWFFSQGSNAQIQMMNSSISNIKDFDAYVNFNGNLTMLNSTFDDTKVGFGDATSKLTVQWYLDVQVIDELGAPLNGINVRIENKTGVEVFSGSTGIDGYIRWIPCNEFLETQSGRINHTPHNVTAANNTHFGMAIPKPTMDTSQEVVITFKRSPVFILVTPDNYSYQNSTTNIPITEYIFAPSGVITQTISFWYRINGGSWYNATYGQDGNDTSNYVEAADWAVISNEYTVLFDVSGLGNSDLVEWYWVASDNDGNSSKDPFNAPPMFYNFTIDRVTPVISNPEPIQNSWVNGIGLFNVSYSDSISEIDLSSVRYKWDDPTYGTGDGWLTPGTITASDASGAWDTTSVEGGTGNHILYWYLMDLAGNSRTQGYTYQIDNEMPITSINVGDPKYRATGGDNWNITTSTLFNFTITENGIGLNHTKYKIDNGNWIEYTSPFTLSGFNDGAHTVYYNSTDNISNVELTKSTVIVVDTSPPNSSMIISSPRYRASPSDMWNVSNTTRFTLSIIENGSGVNISQIKINPSGSWINYTGPFNLTVGEGINTIFFNSTDNFGYAEATKSITVNVDKTAPVTTLNIGQPKSGTSPTIVTVNTQFTLTHNNDLGGVGVEYSWYRLDNNPVQTYTGAFTLPTGTTRIRWGSSDNVSNNEMGNSINVLVDTSAPSTAMDISQPKYGNNPTYITSSTLFSLIHNDDGSGVGVAFTWYKLDDNPPQLYTAAFNVPLGTTNISWGSQDLFGHNETGRLLNVFVDDTTPITTMESTGPRYGSNPTYITTSTIFTLTHNDDIGGVGTAFSWYKFDNSPAIIYTTPFTAPLGTTTIYWGSEDRVKNNETGNAFSVKVDDSPPITDLDLSAPHFESDVTYLTTATIFTLTHNDDGTGVGDDFTWYRLNSGQPQFYTGPFTIPVGTTLVEWGSQDYLGNNETDKSMQVRIDEVKPVTTIKFKEPNYGSDPVIVTSDTRFSFTVEETGSGQAGTYYKIDNSGSWKLFSIAFRVTLEGAHTIHYYSVDYVDNTETVQILDIYVDNTPPAAPILNPIISPTNQKKLTVTGTAEQNSTVHIFVGGNYEGQNFTGSSTTFSSLIVLSEGINEISATATDVFLRTSAISIPLTVILDSTPPKVSEVKPIEDTEDVSLSTNISVTFSESVIKSKAENAFIISPKVPGTFGWNNNVMTFYQSEKFAYGTKYTITIDTKVTDEVANQMASDFEWEFTTVFLDTDGDGEPDVLDDDDDNDGFKDDWEELLNTDAKDILDFPLDTDGDGAPDGDLTNSKKWMDLDDDNDTLSDVEESELGTDPLLADTDGDGHNDNVDLYPTDPLKYKEETEPGQEGIWIGIIVIIIVIFLVIILLGIKRAKKAKIAKEEEEFKVKELSKRQKAKLAKDLYGDLPVIEPKEPLEQPPTEPQPPPSQPPTPPPFTGQDLPPGFPPPPGFTQKPPQQFQQMPMPPMPPPQQGPGQTPPNQKKKL
jgi:parallel beta-helix repeat protein